MRIAAACRQFGLRISGRSLSSDEMKSGRTDRKGSIPRFGIESQESRYGVLVIVPIGIYNTMLTGVFIHDDGQRQPNFSPSPYLHFATNHHIPPLPPLRCFQLAGLMLTLSPGCACDVCAEEYGPHRLPHSIPCGMFFFHKKNFLERKNLNAFVQATSCVPAAAQP
jgi:hypothetical protein